MPLGLGLEYEAQAFALGYASGDAREGLEAFLNKRATGKLQVTDKRMTRFWLSLDQAIDLVEYALHRMQGGEIFVPRAPGLSVLELAHMIAPECEIEDIGIRPGEKLHETLVTEDEGRHAMSNSTHVIIEPELGWWRAFGRATHEQRVPEGYKFTSDNTRRLTLEEVTKIVQKYGASHAAM